MATFTYKVRDTNGKTLSGTVDAENEKQVTDRLREAGYIITMLKAKDASRDIDISFGQKVKLKEIAIFSRQFAIMIQSGIALLRCIDILLDQQENKYFRKVLGQVKKSVEEGSSLSQAMGTHTKVFPDLFVNMIRAGEVGGILDEVLERLSEHYDNEHELSEKIKSATTYPKAIGIFALLIVNVLVIFVIPQFAEMFKGFGAELPMLTKIVLGASDFMRASWYYLAGVTVLIIYIFNRYKKTEGGIKQLDLLKIRMPVFGPMTLKIGVARFTRTLGTLVRSGVPIILALEVTEKTAGNSIIAAGIAAAKESIKEGESIATPLVASGVFPVMVTQMIAVGEESGSLEIMLNKIADFYDREVKFMVESLTSLIEPFLIVFLAIVVGGIVASIMLPMFSVFAQVK